MGAAGRKTAEECFSAGEMVRRVEALYSELLSGAHPR
jgi:hypothetical protein